MIHLRYLRYLRSDASEPADGRTVSYIVAGEQIQHTHRPSAWDKAKWVAAFLLTGCAIGAVAIAIADLFTA